MSINDPQWGNSHRPDQEDPEQVPEKTGTEPVQPQGAQQGQPTQPSPQKPTPPEGPPDLEELWQQMLYNARCRIARLLGRDLPPAPDVVQLQSSIQTQSENVSAPLGAQALSLKSGLIGVSLIIGAWLVSGFYLVDTQQRGVVARFGSVITIKEPGWHWRWPYPIEGVRLINVDADRTLEVGLSAQKGQRTAEGLMLTADGNLVGLAYAVVYQVTDPVGYLTQADDPVDMLALLAENSLRRAVATQTMGAVQASAEKQVSPGGVAFLQSTVERLQTAVAPLALGVAVKGLIIRDVQLPAPVVQTVKAADREEQTKIKAVRDSQVAAAEGLIKARKLAAKLQEESSAYGFALDSQRQALATAGRQSDPAQALKGLADLAVQWRQQYPLVFASPSALQDRMVGAGRPAQSAPVGTVTPDNAPATPAPDTWRDRELMRSRDRVDRPGSGS